VFRSQCSGFGVQGLGFTIVVWDLGFRVQGVGFRVQGAGLRMQGVDVGFRVEV